MAIQETESTITSFGERLRQYREMIGWTSTELAERAGISRTYLWQIEDGRSRPSLEYVQRIAQALGVSITLLLQEDRSPVMKQPIQKNQSHENDTTLREDKLDFFWVLLTHRAAAMQKVYRYEREFSIDKNYYKLLADYNKVIHKLKIEDDCASLAYEAVRLENSMWGEALDANEIQLREVIRLWDDAVKHAERGGRTEALLPLYWNIGNALNAPNSYQLKDAHFYLQKAKHLLMNEDDMDLEDKAGLITTFAWVCYYVGRYDQAEKNFIEAIKHWEGIGDELIRNNNLASAYRGLASTFQRTLKLEEAESYFRKMITSAEDFQNTAGGSKLQMIWGEFRIGSFYRFIGKLSEAEHHLQIADQLWKEHAKSTKPDRGLKAIKTMILNNMAELLIRKGSDDKQVFDHLSLSLKFGLEIDDRRSQAYTYWFYSLAWLHLDQLDKALLYLDNSFENFRVIGLSRYELSSIMTRARVYCLLGAKEAALNLINSIKEEESEDQSIHILVRLTRAFVYSQNNELQRARELFEDNLPTIESLKYDFVRARIDYAETLFALNEHDRTEQELISVKATCEELGYSALLNVVTTKLQELKH